MSSLAFVLIVAGILLIYGEFIWVGKLIFGIAGGCMALLGISMLWKLPHTTSGLFLIACAAACFALEGAFATRWIAGISGSLFWAAGFLRLCPTMPIPPAVALPVSLGFGVVTTALLSVAKRALRNKREV